MSNILRSVVLFVSTTLLFGCDPVPKQHYLLDDPVSWHVNETGDKNTYAYLNLENEQFGEASYTWLPALSDQRTPPPDFGNIDYLVEENNFDTQADGFLRARFFGQTEDGSWILYGFQTKGGTYWIKNTDDNSYGISYLPTDIITNESSTAVDGTIISCIDQVCNNNVGNIGYTIYYDGIATKTTPVADFDTHNFVTKGSIHISTLNEDFSITFTEWLSIYPPLGVVHRILTQGALDDAIDVEMKLSKTNIDTSAFTTDISTP